MLPSVRETTYSADGGPAGTVKSMDCLAELDAELSPTPNAVSTAKLSSAPAPAELGSGFGLADTSSTSVGSAPSESPITNGAAVGGA